MKRSGALWVVLVASTLAWPVTASSQTSLVADPTDGVVPGGEVTSAATRLSASASSLVLLRQSGPEELLLEKPTQPVVALPQSHVRNQKGVPLMVGGGILFVAGAIIGHDAGTLLMVGGAAIGAYGAYVYTGG